MSEKSGDPAIKQNSFSRFDAAMTAILAVSKPAVLAEEKRQKKQRKAERTARKAHRPA